jgi:hypothetical protein
MSPLYCEGKAQPVMHLFLLCYSHASSNHVSARQDAGTVAATKQVQVDPVVCCMQAVKLPLYWTASGQGAESSQDAGPGVGMLRLVNAHDIVPQVPNIL